MSDHGEDCLICGKPVPDYRPVYCCSDFDCGCGGQPLDPCVCSSECGDALYDHIGKPFEDRRILAGIEKWSPKSEDKHEQQQTD
jgi:hypothetical protein